MKTLRELEKIAQAALKSEYGFAPSLREISILGSNGDGTYMAFFVNLKYYRFDSYKMHDGSIWVGKGTIEKLPEYDITFSPI